MAKGQMKKPKADKPKGRGSAYKHSLAKGASAPDPFPKKTRTGRQPK
jgi:hypothetical protein